jgi:hypothetical protein
MAGDLVRIPPERSLQEAVDDYFMRHDHGAFPVDEQGQTIGLLTLRGIRRVPREQWPTHRVRDHMVPSATRSWWPPTPGWTACSASSRTARPGGSWSPTTARWWESSPPRT